MSTRGVGILLCGLALTLASCFESAPRKLNVLFISIDDLRPSLGCYGETSARTPNLDRLAESGTRFDRAYCQKATCAPSRASVLTGCRPDTTGVLDLNTHYREALPDLVVLPELFRKNGWFTAALGKVHHGPPTGRTAGKLDDPRAWSVDCWRPDRWQTYYGTAEAQRIQRELEVEAQREADKRDGIVWGVPRGMAWDAPDVTDSELGDGMIADRAIELLEQHAEEPFFLAVGFLKPHMPYVAPKRYWDMHTRESLPALLNESAPFDAPGVALQDSAEARAHFNVPRSGPISLEMRRDLVHAYYACVSYVDAQVGRVLTKLDELELTDDTIVVVWGDHGWHLGEQGIFGKHTNYESAVRAPLLIRVPGLNQEAASDSLVELVDLYPTLADLCGLAAPERIEGSSLRSLLTEKGGSCKDAVFHQYSRGIAGKKGIARGNSIRTATHRYVEWQYPAGRIERELYDLVADPRELENVAAREPALVKELSERLTAGWRARASHES